MALRDLLKPKQVWGAIDDPATWLLVVSVREDYLIFANFVSCGPQKMSIDNWEEAMLKRNGTEITNHTQPYRSDGL